MDIANLGKAVDLFGDEEDKKTEEDATTSAKFCHIRMQQRNGRKCITTVQGLDPRLDFKKIIKTIKKTYCCNGTIVEDDEMGQVLQFQGDHRDNLLAWLVDNEVMEKSLIKKHGN